MVWPTKEELMSSISIRRITDECHSLSSCGLQSCARLLRCGDVPEEPQMRYLIWYEDRGRRVQSNIQQTANGQPKPTPQVSSKNYPSQKWMQRHDSSASAHKVLCDFKAARMNGTRLSPNSHSEQKVYFYKSQNTKLHDKEHK